MQPDMDYAIEKAAKAIDKHSITAKPRRRKNKDSKNYQTFRKKKEFNNQLDKCYLLLGKAYFYKKKYTMANNTFRFIQRQYAEDEALMTEVSIWLFRSLTEMGRYEEAARIMDRLDGSTLKRKQREMVAAARTDFYVRQGMYEQAIPEAERLVRTCKSIKRKPRYNFLLSQLYVKENQDGAAKLALKKATRFNFNYEMVFNARIGMALAYQEGDAAVEKKLKKMLRDSRNEEFQDRIYYALANIENKRGNEEGAAGLYWKSVHASVDNDNQQALSFVKLGDYYFKNKAYVQAQSCYDSCLLVMDSRYEDYERLKFLLTDLTELVTNLRIIQTQDSLQRIAVLPEEERNRLIDDKITAIKEQENTRKEQERREQAERNFYRRNDMLSRGDAFSQGNRGGDWYFYNPVTIALGKNDFKRKWGRRKLEDNWRRRNKASIGLADETGEELAEMTGGEREVKDVKSREYYLQDLPLTPEMLQASEKQIEEAYYKAGEIYLYRLNDPEKALECFDAYIQRFKNTANLPMVYYLASTTALKAGKAAEAERYKTELTALFPESDFARGLQDPNYFRQVEDVLKVVEKKYQEAYRYYQKVYYHEAAQICDRILKAYPDNKLKSNVLFLKAMCVVNTGSPQEAKNALEEVIAARPGKEILQVTSDILASLAVGEKPVRYSEAEMAQARSLQANRNWQFDEEVLAGRSRKEETTYKIEKEKEQWVVLFLPQEFTTVQETRFKARLKFIHAAEMAEGKVMK
ncbi:MAG: tetratricopeptide repeat protein [Odoribacter splanchnicus]